MKQWVLIAGVVVVLGGMAWYFGRPAPRDKEMEPKTLAQQTAPDTHLEAPRTLPAKVIEVIDLARAYEPTPEEGTSDSTTAAANLITFPEAGFERMPLAHVSGPETTTIQPRVMIEEKLSIPPRRVD